MKSNIELTKHPAAKFSKELVEETIRCFKEENGVEFTYEQSEEVLNNLAGLYLAFSNKDQKVY